MGNLYEELRRRKVFRVAAVYGVVAWLLIQVADTVLPALQMPDWTISFVTVLFILGFPIAVILAWAYETTPTGIKPDHHVQTPSSAQVSSVQPVNYLILVIVILVAGFQVADRFRVGSEPADLAEANTAPSSRLTRVSIHIPEDEYFDPRRGDFDISDDGSLFVYRGIDENGEPLLWLRRWDELSGRPLLGAREGARPKISPNGEEVVFGGGGIQIASLTGGLSRTLVESDETGQGSADWDPEGDWIYFSNKQSGTSRIPATGGEIETVTTVNKDNGEVSHDFVEVLPDNKIIYQIQRIDGTNIIQAANLSTGEKKDLSEGKFPIYSNTGHVLFQASDEPRLLAAPFNLETLEFTDSASPLATGLLRVGAGNAANIGVSDTGRLVYRLGTNASRPGSPMWVDRAGNATEIDPGWSVLANNQSGTMALSPLGDQLAITLLERGAGLDLWVKRLDDGPLSRITFTGQSNLYPTWSGDGKMLSYSVGIPGVGVSRWQKNADGSGTEQLLLERPGSLVYQADYSPDGRWMVYRERPINSAASTGDIYAVDTIANGEPVPLLVGEHYYHSIALSPDGRWLSYVSTESGRDEVYVRPFPDTDAGRWQVSTDGGTEPVWAHSGKELFYRNELDELVAVQLSDGDTFAWDSQDVLFSMSEYRSSTAHPAYDVDLDDQRFVTIKLGAVADSELILVDNWLELLK